MTSPAEKTFPRSTPTIGSNLTIDSEQGGLACLRMRHDVGVLPAGARPALPPDVRVLCRVPRTSGRTRPAHHARSDPPRPISLALRCHAPCPSRLVPTLSRLISYISGPDSARPLIPHPTAGGGTASMLTCFTIRRRTSGAQNHPILLSRVHYDRGAHRMRSVLPVPPDVLIFSAASSILSSTGLPSKLCARTTVARRLSSSHSSVLSVAPLDSLNHPTCFVQAIRCARTTSRLLAPPSSSWTRRATIRHFTRWSLLLRFQCP
ncbi:hypothetical protein BD309DRAFT_439395 [Dichomitus squalens]|nr:hypothetical protein BD309DRAFT_439395 [Dichomitus squalens]